MKPEYIDTHAHLTHEDYENDLDVVIQNAKDNKVAIITIGTDLEDSKRAIKIAEENENIFAIVGFHPIDTKHSTLEEFKEMEELIKHPKCVGVGECGLDYFRPEDADNKEKQKDFFVRQVALAIEYKKPLMIHCREAYDDTLEILKVYKEVSPGDGRHPQSHLRHPREGGDPGLKVNFHFFNQSPQIAKELLDLGFQVSFTGIITFAKELEETVKFVPIDKMMSETDSPYAAPKPFRGNRNEPSYVIEVVKQIADFKKVDLEETKSKLLKNAEEFFGINL